MAAVTDPKELGPFSVHRWLSGRFVAKCALRLAPLLFVRPGELRHAEWSEIDLEAGEWNIPAAKMRCDSLTLFRYQARQLKFSVI